MINMKLAHDIKVDGDRFGLDGKVLSGGIWLAEVTPELCRRYLATQWDDSAEVDIQDLIHFPLTQLPQFIGWKTPKNPMAKDEPRPGWYVIAAVDPGLFDGDEILESDCWHSEDAAKDHANRMLQDWGMA